MVSTLLTEDIESKSNENIFLCVFNLQGNEELIQGWRNFLVSMFSVKRTSQASIIFVRSLSANCLDYQPKREKYLVCFLV